MLCSDTCSSEFYGFFGQIAIAFEEPILRPTTAEAPRWLTGKPVKRLREQSALAGHDALESESGQIS